LQIFNNYGLFQKKKRYLVHLQMLSNNRQKQLKQLSTKKGREAQQKFLIEGKKIVSELIVRNYPFELICCTALYVDEISGIAEKAHIALEVVTEKQLQDVSALQHPQPVFGVAQIKKNHLDFSVLKNQVTLVLDDVSDPGNMGTIIRLADWYGVKNIICSSNTVELHNPKVIQASMGSFCNVNVSYCESLELFFNTKEILELKLPLIGTTLQGKPYKTIEPQPCFLVLGNEAKGISQKVLNKLDHQILIEGNKNKFAESLNVSVAATLVTSYFCGAL
jgi:RNA methyltransferase, TrmH family